MVTRSPEEVNFVVPLVWLDTRTKSTVDHIEAKTPKKTLEHVRVSIPHELSCAGEIVSKYSSCNIHVSQYNSVNCYCMINTGKRTEWSLIQSVIIRVITKLDGHEEGA